MKQPPAHISILGAGCAGLSLGCYAAEADSRLDISVFGRLSPAATSSHIWGFWKTGWLDTPASMARQSWKSWQIITEQGAICQTSHAYPYHALESADWLSYCRQQLAGRAEFFDDMPDEPDMGYPCFDSRTPQMPARPMLQHFVGLEIYSARALFTPDTLTLMDFRCDQSHGIHFIYLLPFSEHQALVESTLFSPDLLEEETYLGFIKNYLAQHYQLDSYEEIRRERGIIPMCETMATGQNSLPIGANGGCIRPSSGYGFSFIIRQVTELVADMKAGRLATSRAGLRAPHRWLDRQLDRIFLRVLHDHPELAPSLFLSMAKALDGDEMAIFMSGFARPATYAKLIWAMPKLVFIRAAFGCYLAPSR
jgi:lycopene beta-cyclase